MARSFVERYSDPGDLVLDPFAGFATTLTTAEALVGMVGRAVFGFVRGLGHLPTLYLAVFEGALLVGAPAAVLGVLLVGLRDLGGRQGRHSA